MRKDKSEAATYRSFTLYLLAASLAGFAVNIIQTPELALLVTTWCFSRNYLYTPIPPALTTKERYR